MSASEWGPIFTARTVSFVLPCSTKFLKDFELSCWSKNLLEQTIDLGSVRGMQKVVSYTPYVCPHFFKARQLSCRSMIASTMEEKT